MSSFMNVCHAPRLGTSLTRAEALDNPRFCGLSHNGHGCLGKICGLPQGLRTQWNICRFLDAPESGARVCPRTVHAEARRTRKIKHHKETVRRGELWRARGSRFAARRLTVSLWILSAAFSAS